MSTDIEDRARRLDECMCEVIRREGRPEAQRRARRDAIVCALRAASTAEREACAAHLERRGARNPQGLVRANVVAEELRARRDR